MGAEYCTMHNEGCVENHARLLTLPHIRLAARGLPFATPSTVMMILVQIGSQTAHLYPSPFVHRYVHVHKYLNLTIPMHRNWVRLPGGDLMTYAGFQSLFFFLVVNYSNAPSFQLCTRVPSASQSIFWQSQNTFDSTPHKPSHIQLSVRIPAVRVPILHIMKKTVRAKTGFDSQTEMTYVDLN